MFANSSTNLSLLMHLLFITDGLISGEKKFCISIQMSTMRQVTMDPPLKNIYKTLKTCLQWQQANTCTKFNKCIHLTHFSFFTSLKQLCQNNVKKCLVSLGKQRLALLYRATYHVNSPPLQRLLLVLSPYTGSLLLHLIHCV